MNRRMRREDLGSSGAGRTDIEADNVGVQKKAQGEKVGKRSFKGLRVISAKRSKGGR